MPEWLLRLRLALEVTRMKLANSFKRWMRYRPAKLGALATLPLVRCAMATPRLNWILAVFWSVIWRTPQLPYIGRQGRYNRESNIAELLPPKPADAERSVIFLHNSYYHFFYLAKALRKRGWDAVLVSNFSPDNADNLYFHGEDVNLFSDDKRELEKRLYSLYKILPTRFRMIHFAGMHYMSLFPGNCHQYGIPWDFIKFKKDGVKIGYTNSGCNDGIRQSIYKQHKNVCAKCAWEDQPKVCSDKHSWIWGQKLLMLCDLISTSNTYGNEWTGEDFVYREPLTMALDPEIWNPNLEVPDAWRLRRTNGELVVVHGFGNAKIRRVNGRDIKGSQAIISAIKKLQKEGVNVRLIHPTNVKNLDMRYLQVQADIIVDQLNIGRYGAQAREAMMLGKPTICHIDRREPRGARQLECLAECPLIDATEETIYSVLKQLLLTSKEERSRIGTASRAYAMKWHSADRAAERFEHVYDRMMAGLPLNVPDAELFGGIENRGRRRHMY